jgi:hypothetical protein
MGLAAHPRRGHRTGGGLNLRVIAPRISWYPIGSGVDARHSPRRAVGQPGDVTIDVRTGAFDHVAMTISRPVQEFTSSWNVT